MRLILDSSSKKKLFILLKEKYKCNSINELSFKIKISKKTLQGWFYTNKSVPSNFIEPSILEKLELIDKKENNWGQINGGKKGYFNAIKKYGIKKFRRMNAFGGKRAAITKEKTAKKDFIVNPKDSSFLEFYGNLLGDGWLSNYLSGKKKVWIVGFCGNLSKDKEFIEDYRRRVRILFHRDRKTREIPKNNLLVILFSHKLLLKYLNEKLAFPIGKKENLIIHSSIISLGFDKVKFVLRGIFDTDGTFFLQKNRKGIPSFPVISIHMNEIKLIRQMGEILEKKGFRVNYSDYGKMIRIQGKEQLKKWMNNIGSSNPKHVNKINNYFDKIARVAQPG